MLLSTKLARCLTLTSRRLAGCSRSQSTASNTIDSSQTNTTDSSSAHKEANFGFKKVKYEEKQGKGKPTVH
jgi:hypothetical protein